MVSLRLILSPNLYIFMLYKYKIFLYNKDKLEILNKQ